MVMRPSTLPCHRSAKATESARPTGPLRAEECGTEVGADARVGHCLCGLIHEEVVIGEGGDAALDHLGDGHQRAQVHVALAHVDLHRPDVVVEPASDGTSSAAPRRKVIAAWQCVLISPGMATMPSASMTSRARGACAGLGSMRVSRLPVISSVVPGANVVRSAVTPSSAVQLTMARSASGPAGSSDIP